MKPENLLEDLSEQLDTWATKLVRCGMTDFAFELRLEAELIRVALEKNQVHA